MSEETNSEELVEYEGRRIYPEVARYLQGYKEALRDHRRVTDKLDYEYQTARQELEWSAEDASASVDWRYDQGDEHWVLKRDLDRAYNEQREAARLAFTQVGHELLESPHKEVKFIAKECLFAHEGSEIEGHARTILGILPADTEEIWRVAKEEADMCRVFDQFYQRAESAGVFQKEGEDPFPGMRELAAFRRYIERNHGISSTTRIMERANPAFKAIKADYDRRLEEAKAAWQRLDEAHAENADRNRSEVVSTDGHGNPLLLTPAGALTSESLEA